ncbi:hypothetical protein ACFX16_030428 [Malus domestica]|uniref:Uncharacterized protein n=1 Tax=Malus domestica TaxID=3750 RepID=A0A498K712_MALDO|nr:hypothetical protein DVH24_003840 [Malus domestica]
MGMPSTLPRVCVLRGLGTAYFMSLTSLGDGHSSYKIGTSPTPSLAQELFNINSGCWNLDSIRSPISVEESAIIECTLWETYLLVITSFGLG